MGIIGRLIEDIVLVRLNGKWKKKLCALERPSKFSNSLKLYVFNDDGTTCRCQDVHAYILGVDAKHDGTIMFVCTYKLRCISFEHFEKMTKWDDMLKANLTCSYFHADLIVAPKDSILHSYARHQNCFPLIRMYTNQAFSPPVKLCSTLYNNSSDGYLHVTRDRICFTTGPGCSRPRLLATWTFDNDEIVQCGTARVQNAVKGNFSDPPSLFFLTAFSDHPEAPGSHLFLSDRATDLCDVIEYTNRAAVYQADWRRLTCMAALIDSSSYSKGYDFDQTSSLCNPIDPATSLSYSSTTQNTEVSPQGKCMNRRINDEIPFVTLTSSSNESSTRSIVTQMDIHSNESHKKLKEQMIVDPFLHSVCDPRKCVSMHPRRRFSNHLMSCNRRRIGSFIESEHNFNLSCFPKPQLPNEHDATTSRACSLCLNDHESIPTSIPSTHHCDSLNNINVNTNPQLYRYSRHIHCSQKCNICYWRRFQSYWVTLSSQPLDTLKLNQLLYQPYCSFCFKGIPRYCDVHLSHSNSHESCGGRFIMKSCDDKNICPSCSEGLVKSNIFNDTFPPDNCPQQNISIRSNIPCNKTLSDFISTDKNECHNMATTYTLTTAKPKLAFINNPHKTLSFSEQHVCKPPTDTTSRSDTNTTSQDIRHCKRLPSNWSTISRRLTSNGDASGNIAHCISTRTRQTEINWYLFNQNSPTPTVIPGSQYTKTRQLASSICESLVPYRQESCNSCSHLSSAVAHYPPCKQDGIKSSSVFLSSTAPLWAAAPTYSKPKTGKLYVSRKEIQALRVDQQHQLSVSQTNMKDFCYCFQLDSSNKPFHVGNHPSESGNTLTFLTGTADGNESLQGKLCPFNNKVQVEASSFYPVTTNVSNIDSVSQTSSDPFNTCKSDRMLQFFSGPNINMLPNTLDNELQPVSERHSSIITSPSTRCIHSDDVSCSRQDDGVYNVSNTSKLPVGTGVILENPKSYLNLLGFQRNGSTVLNHSDAAVHYINFSPNCLVPNYFSDPICVQFTNSQRNNQCAGLSQIPRVTAAKQILPDCLLGIPPIPSRWITPTDVFNDSNSHIPRTLHLHYAHLTLSDSIHNSTSDACLHGKSSDLAINYGTGYEKKTSHYLSHSLRCALSCNANYSETERLDHNYNQIGNNCDDRSLQGLNYVTIDMRQTRALSELGQEFSSSTGLMCNASYHIPLPKCFLRDHVNNRKDYGNVRSSSIFSGLRKHLTNPRIHPSYFVRGKDKSAF
ncbi:hypothetical protein MN116_004069 [Schistosoma mekongi]|uniref:Uncharacterized protein n=1 Tax=Schistosoma mekongi TaxID=38744 RepID=A0AAE2D6D9_SCHME|nr:hypothetical protein MN116_004069 [Schistosoma mekongi]